MNYLTDDEIRAELRRSAVEDEYPFQRLGHFALRAVQQYREPEEWLHMMRNDDIRTLFLLVAEALES